jgi:hypothetical protein
VKARTQGAFALLVPLLIAAPAKAAPVGTGAPLAVLGLEAERAHDVEAQTLTNELRQVVVESAGHSLYVSNPALLLAAGRVKCDLVPFGRRYGPETDRGIDAGCERSMVARLGIGQMLWGHVYDEGSVVRVKLHSFREGKPGRVETLAYDTAAPKRLARRFYLKLMAPESSGDVRLVGEASFEGAELWVDGKAEGPYAASLELTLPTGEHTFELRREGRTVGQAKASVVAEKTSEVRLAFVPRINLDPTEGFRDPPPVPQTPRRSALPWVFGGVGIAGLGGAAIFFALRRGEQNDLERVCPENTCHSSQRDATDRAALYGTLSLASLGVGAVGVGLATYTWLRTPRAYAAGVAKPSTFVGVSVTPLIGGGASASVAGRFLRRCAGRLVWSGSESS